MIVSAQTGLVKAPFDVRFRKRSCLLTPESRRVQCMTPCPLWAKSGHSAPRQRLALFDHLIGEGKQLVGNLEAERPRGLEVDGKLELDRRFHWQICGLGALQDTIDI